MPGGTRNLKITLNYDASPADRESQAYVEREKKRQDEILSKTEVAEAARLELIKRKNRAAIAEVVRATENRDRIGEASHEKAMAAWDAQQKKQAAVANAIRGATTQVLSFGAATLGLQSAQGVLQMFINEFEAARAYASKVTDEIQRMRLGIRELQSMRGETGRTGAGIAHLFEQAARTGQTTEEVRQMEEAGLGIGELAIGDEKGKVMSRPEFERVMIAAGRAHAIEGGDSEAFGRMAGRVILEHQGEGKMAPAEAEARLARLIEIQKPGGFKSFTQAEGQYSKLAAYTSSKALSQEEAMGLVSMLSASGPAEEAGTHAQQLINSLLAADVRSRSPRFAEGVEGEKTDQYLAALGVKPGTKVPEKLRMIAADVAAKEKADKKFDSNTYLLTHGFANDQGRQAIVRMAQALNRGQMDEIIKRQNAGLQFGKGGRGVYEDRFADFAAHDPTVGARLAEMSERASDMARGTKEEDLKSIQRGAFARLRRRNEIGAWGNFEEYFQSSGLNPRNLFGGDSGKIRMESQAMVAERARAAGVDFQIPTRVDAKTGARTTEYVGDERLQQVMTQIRQAGFNPSEKAADNIRAAAADIKAAAAELRSAAKGPDVPPPMGGRPAAVAPR